MSDCNRTLRGGGLVALTAVTLAACTTTTNPYECRGQGMGSVLSGCAGDVAARTDEIRTDVEAVEAETDLIAMDTAERQKEVERLEARVNELKGKLDASDDQIMELREQLDEQRDQNLIDQEAYDAKTIELDNLELRVEEFRNIPVMAFTPEAADDLENFLDVEFVNVSSSIMEIEFN